MQKRTESRIEEAVEYITRSISEILKMVDGDLLSNIVEMLLSAKKIFVYGVGRSGLVGKAFAMRLVQLGLEAHFIGETITPIVKKEDAVLLISNIGETYSAIQTAQIVKRIGAKAAVITSRKDSTLAKLADLCIVIPVRVEEVNTDLAPLGTLFEISALTLLDGTVSALMLKKGETNESMRERHAIWV